MRIEVASSSNMLASLTRTTAGLSLRTRCVPRLGRAALSVQGPRVLSTPFAIGRVVSRDVHHSSPSNKDSPIGVSAALLASSKGTSSLQLTVASILTTTSPLDSDDSANHPTIFASEFSLQDRVALVTGGNRGLGLEMALSFLEAGARAVYTIDLPQEPSDGWRTVQKFASTMQMPGEGKAGRLEYICGDVTDQVGFHCFSILLSSHSHSIKQRMWKLAEEIGDKEQRLDVCVAAAGIGTDSIDCLEYPADVHRKVCPFCGTGLMVSHKSRNIDHRNKHHGRAVHSSSCGPPNGPFRAWREYHPHRQRCWLNRNISTLIVSCSYCIHSSNMVLLQSMGTVAYNTSKGAVLQMTRSMACELAPRGVRVNSISPGWIHTPYVLPFITSHCAWTEKLNLTQDDGRDDRRRPVVLRANYAHGSRWSPARAARRCCMACERREFVLYGKQASHISP